MARTIDIAEEINRFREKLIDLTTNNRLLSYRKSRSRTLVIVDEHPDQVYERLAVQGKPFSFEPMVEQLALRGLEPSKPPDFRAAPPEACAPRNRSDGKLQTGLDEDRLEKVLKTIRSDANTAIQETGVNLLYMAFGMLEWYESDVSDRPLLSPLILVPVSIAREFEGRSRRWRYSVSHSGEEIQSNLCLFKRFEKDFGLSLPEYDESQLPDEYFASVGRVIGHHPRWKVRGEMLIGFFSFRKLLMYLDLDPEKWTGDDSLGANTVLQQIIAGAQVEGGSPVFLKDYDVDGNPVAERIALAADADSSQHSALCDISAGRNLVIEGPPGTGKSQTITNAIAAAIEQGKTVLFVSEKLAALDVVYKNLERLGLHHFALELHSEGAKPQKVYHDLLMRLAANFPAPRQIEWVRDRLESAKAHLREYLDVCQATLGPRGEPVYELFWRIVESRSRNVPFLREASVDLAIDRTALNRRIEVLREIAAHVQDVGKPAEHPWIGFSAVRLFPSNFDEFRDAMVQLARAASVVSNSIESLKRAFGLDADEVLALASRLDAGQLSTIQSPPATPEGVQLSRLLSATGRKVVGELASQLTRLHESQAIASLATRDVAAAASPAREITEEINAHLSKPLCALTLQQLRELSTRFENILRLVRDGTSYRDSLAKYGHGPVRNMAELRQALDRHRLLLHPVIQTPDILVPDLFLARTESQFVAAAAHAAKLSDAGKALTKQFELADVPACVELPALRRTLRSHAESFFRLLNSEYRAARRKVRAFVRHGIRLRGQNLDRALRELEAWLTQKPQFAADTRLSQAFGALFKGTDTDWNQLELLIRWIKTARQHGLGFADTERFRRVLAQELSVVDPNAISGHVDALVQECAEPLLRKALFQDCAGIEHVAFEHIRSQAELQLRTVSSILRLAQELEFPIASSIDDVARAAKSICTAIEIRVEIGSNENFSEMVGGGATPLALSSAALTRQLNWMDRLLELMLPLPVLQWLLETDTGVRVAQLTTDFVTANTAHRQWCGAREAVASYGSSGDEFLKLGASKIDPACIAKISALTGNLEQVQPWSTFCRAIARAEEMGLEGFTHAILSGELDAAIAAEAFDRTFNERLAHKAILDNPALKDFSRQRMDKTREQLQTNDRELLELNRRVIAAIVASRRPPSGITTGRVSELTELGLIQREIQKQKRHTKIRELINRAGRALQILKPCFMMSPLSVAQFIPPGAVHFDMVVMDEASQIKPEDALGTLIRAKQLVVVGDPKQLPPTTFFDRMAADEVAEEEETLLDDTESILEVAMKAFTSVRRLKWHYRSHHESLIAFSNDRFYENELVVFPSPTRETGKLGVLFHLVDGGQFVGGCNPVEAECVAQAIVAHAIQSPSESLGVGTFNLAQREAIQDRLDAICGGDSRARDAVEMLLKHSSPVFIKNLENLQGDERDVIFISYTYGADPATGRVLNRFGPINSPNGWRRLNVLVTRARRRVEVFSSMRPEDIVGGPERSRGMNSMKDYLLYAQTGILSDRGKLTNREPDSHFEVAVARVVQRHGLQVVPQVGVAGYFIDLGILRPGSDCEFLLGIECDGATYHSAKSARDRDRLREEVIRRRGWNLHRIWSTDWFMNQRSEEERLENAIRALL